MTARATSLYKLAGEAIEESLYYCNITGQQLQFDEISKLIAMNRVPAVIEYAAHDHLSERINEA